MFVALSVSFLIRLVALIWGLVLLYRLRDRRLVLLVGILAVLAATGALDLTAARGEPDPADPLGPALATSLLMVVAVFLLGNYAVAREARERDGEDSAGSTLRASETKFSTIFHASPDAIVLSSYPEGRIFDVNESFTATTGYSREEAAGRTSQELELWSDPEQRVRLGERLRLRGAVRNMESEFRHKSGVARTCLVSAEIIDLGGRSSVLTMLRDISERKRVEEEREALIRELEAKNAELERFTYTVSHDLKSPLVTIRGFLGLLERDAAAGDVARMRRDAERIRAATDVMRRLLDELLELSRIGRQLNPPEEVPLAELAREAADLVAVQVTEAGAAVRISPSLPVVEGDRARLLEVFQNLIENAAKYMGDQASPRIDIETRKEGSTVVCCVRDNGMGIEPRYHEKVFGLFERLNPDQEGTGVGLALVKRIIEVHGGRIWVESQGSGRGSTFCFVLPQQEAGSLEPPAMSDSPAA